MRDLILKFASGLRFPVLFFATAGLFLLDLVVPDLVPFADELLLGLLTILFGTWQKRRKDRREASGDSSERPINKNDDDIIDITVEEER